MHFYISAKRVTVSSRGICFSDVMKVKGGQNRRFSYRSVFPTVLVAGLLLPFLFIRAAFLALDSSNRCYSAIDCIGLGWRLGPAFLRGRDTSVALGNELARAFLEAKGGGIDSPEADVSSLQSFSELVADVTSHRHDIKEFATKTRDMLLNMERKVRSARLQGSIYRHMASIGIPKSMHCLCLRLAEEYSMNALARSPLPPPEFVHRLKSNLYIHFAILTDNVLAASVVVSSTVRNCGKPERMVFHVVTDRKTYSAMHAWFALHPILPAVVEVKGLHKYDWSTHVNKELMEMVEIHRAHCRHFCYFNGEGYYKLQSMRPSYTSFLNHLPIYLPELFPELERIVFLHDDVVVQHDLAPLWKSNLNGKVNGAVGMWDADGKNYCLGRTYGDYLNFSNSMISSKFQPGQCAWLYGVNVFNLQAWSKTNITQNYHRWLKHNSDSGFSLWRLGALPPALVAFDGHVHPIDPRWHTFGLGHRPNVEENLENVAVVHFSGPAKPWLAIGFPEVRSLWSTYVNFSDEFIRHCRFMG